MKIPLNDFEFYIDEPFLKKGLAYFKKGAVTDVAEISKGEYEAIVQGTNEYLVTMSIKKGEINQFHCTCLYDQGLVCKHVAAVIFYMEQETLGIAAAAPKAKQVKSKPVAKKASKKKTIPEQVAEIVEQLPKDELVDFLVYLSKKSSSNAQMILDHFAEKNDQASINYYAKQIRKIITSLTNKDKYNPWKNIGLIARAVFEKYQVAVLHLEKGNCTTAAFMSLAIIEELIRSLDFLDDSNAELSSMIKLSFDNIKQISQKEGEEALKCLIFEYSLDAFIQKKFVGWDWHINFLKIAADFRQGSQDVERLLFIIDHTNIENALVEEVQIIRFRLLLHSGREQEANAYLESNLQNSAFRADAIITAINQKNYSRAITLAKEGVEIDKASRPGYAASWKLFLLEVAEIQNQSSEIVAYAKDLFFAHPEKRETYFQLLKKHTPSKNWAIMLNELLQPTQKMHTWNARPILADIYIWEEQWNLLLKLVSEKPSFSELTKYELPLLEHYPEEWKNLYGTAIIEYAQIANSRANYKEIVKQLVKLYKSGGESNAQKIVSILRSVFKNRPSLMEELRVF
ncbi:MAG: hypothetical protein RLY89_2808 [Bacteroidota bacterium]